MLWRNNPSEVRHQVKASVIFSMHSRYCIDPNWSSIILYNCTGNRQPQMNYLIWQKAQLSEASIISTSSRLTGKTLLPLVNATVLFVWTQLSIIVLPTPNFPLPPDVSRRRCFQLAAVQRISSPSARESPRKAAISSVSLVTKPPGLCSGLLRSPCR